MASMKNGQLNERTVSFMFVLAAPPLIVLGFGKLSKHVKGTCSPVKQVRCIGRLCQKSFASHFRFRWCAQAPARSRSAFGFLVSFAIPKKVSELDLWASLVY